MRVGSLPRRDATTPSAAQPDTRPRATTLPRLRQPAIADVSRLRACVLGLLVAASVSRKPVSPADSR